MEQILFRGANGLHRAAAIAASPAGRGAMKMRISIAMATYNGARFLTAQLDSFLGQRRRPDELVISDDGSSDGTLGLLEDFARAAPFAVRIYANSQHRGLVANFARAIGRCEGDIIFLSDQDDVWFADKLEAVQQAFLRPGRPGRPVVVVNDAELIAADGRRTGLTKAGQTRAAGLSDSAMVTGCCTAFRRELVPLLLPIPPAYGNHDEWLHAVAGKVGPRVFLPDALQFHRRHGANASNALTSQLRPISRLERMLGRATRASGETLEQHLRRYVERADLVLGRLAAHQDALRALGDEAWQAAQRETLRTRRNAALGRLKLHRAPRIARLPSVLCLLSAGGYRYAGRWRGAVDDCVFR